MIEVIDNYLSHQLFSNLKKCILDHNFPWFYAESSVTDDKIPQFIHMAYCEHKPTSFFWDNLKPIVDYIDPIALFRLKFNATPRFSSIIEKPLHYDFIDVDGTPSENMKVCLIYINSNDGYTYFESGEKIESKENRAVFFPANLKHSGTNCTDSDLRIVMNINYYNA